MAIIQNRKPVTLGTLILTTIISILLIMFVLLPRYRDYTQKKGVLQTSQATHDDLENKKQHLIEQVKAMNDQKEKIDLLNEAIPDSSSVPDLYAHLESMTKAANLTIAALQAIDVTEKEDAEKARAAAANTPVGVGNTATATTTGKAPTPAPASAINAASAAPTGGLGMVTVTMEANGSLESFDQFLASLEKSLRLIDVQSVDISNDPDKGLTFHLIFKTYYQKK